MKRIWVDGEKCLGCKTCELQCAVERCSVTKTLTAAVKEEPKPTARVGVYGPTGASFPLQCRHCQDATCLKACPSGAMQRDADKGTVVVDQTKCRGCWMCVMSCPFGAVTPSPAYKVAMKCDACVDMEEPACVASCPTGALVYGDEEAYQPVLAAKRGRLAVYAKTAPAVSRNCPVSLDYAREGE